jgi:transcription antitermination protein NusB
MTAMGGSRRRGRELALQALYQMDVTGGESHVPAAELWRHFDDDEALPEPSRTFATELVRGVLETRARIDELIAESAEHWRLDRLSQIDRNILRIGAYELLCRRDVPPNVAIDEAIEIAKRFGNDESAVFVNGVLDHIATAVGAKTGRDAP